MTASGRPHAVVVGGGVSGIAAAIALADAGRRVTLLERRAFLGGRAYSFPDALTGETVDNGQHVLLGCCTNALDLLGRFGVRHLIDWSQRFHYLTPGAAPQTRNLHRHDLAPARLPAPLHFLPGIARWSALRPGERFAVMRAFTSLLLTGRTRRETIARGPFASWLAAQGQSERLRRLFWGPIVEGAVNETLDLAAAGPCLQVFLEGFLAHPEAAHLGVPRLDLTRLLEPGCRRALELAGGTVRTRANVVGFDFDQEDLMRPPSAVRLASGETIAADEFVLALPAPALGRLAEREVGLRLGGLPLDEIDTSSITGVHLWLDRVVTDLPHAALLESPMHWFFAKPTRHEGTAQRLALIVSASRNLEARGQAEIIDLAESELRRFLPGMRGARRVHAVAVKETRATFSATPGIEAIRPGPRTPHRNLMLAGDWTRTGWPSTIEGSIRSGRIAAGRCTGENHLVPDLAPGPLARLLVRP